MKLILRFFGWAFGLGTVAFLLGAAGVAIYIITVTKELPDYTTLRNYEPPIMSRVHAADGQLMAEYARERRLYLPIQAVPKLVVQAFLAGSLVRDERPLLDAELWRRGFLLTRQAVLNDAVVAKGALARILDMHLRVGDQDAGPIKADGLIVATPTGSTAYSLSAGGPILHPSLEAVVISPICPHTLTLRPSVVPSSRTISITVVDAEDAHLTLDGQVGHPIIPGDEVRLRQSRAWITLLQRPGLDFFQLLQQKLHWGDR